MGDLIACTALRAVKAERLYRPGEQLELAPADADELEAIGAVRRVQVADPDPGAGTRSPPPPENPDEPPTDTRPLSTVKGIGAKVESQLAQLGVLSLSDLATLSDDALMPIAEDLDIVGDALRAIIDWRSQARALVEEGAGGG